MTDLRLTPTGPSGPSALSGRPRYPEVTAGPSTDPPDPPNAPDQPDTPDPPPPEPPHDGCAGLRAELAERTEDLQRVQAQYDNYRRRVHRDRLAVREIAVVNVLSGLLPVLDALDRARVSGEVTGGFSAVAETLETHLGELGLRSFGAAGERFDPARHEAVEYYSSAEVEEPTCVSVLRPGYVVGEHLLRPAAVVVAEPPDAA